MFKYKSIKQELFAERKKNEQLQAESAKNKSDIDYLAMMCDVELEVNNTGMEVNGNE